MLVWATGTATPIELDRPRPRQRRLGGRRRHEQLQRECRNHDDRNSDAHKANHALSGHEVADLSEPPKE
jgi:hypothetical protein